jgi:hypothetical protein
MLGHQLEETVSYCPSCGGDSRLVESTGWCPSCTLATDPLLRLCSCGQFFSRKAHRSKCWDCRREEWLTRHADEIEKYMLTGLTASKAVKRVQKDIRPVCHKCGNAIKGGKQGDRFCRTNDGCEKASDNYSALRKTGLGPDVALAIATGRVAVIQIPSN